MKSQLKARPDESYDSALNLSRRIVLPVLSSCGLASGDAGVVPVHGMSSFGIGAATRGPRLTS